MNCTYISYISCLKVALACLFLWIASNTKPPTHPLLCPHLANFSQWGKKSTLWVSICGRVLPVHTWRHTSSHVWLCGQCVICAQRVTCLLGNTWGDLKGPRWRELQGGGSVSVGVCGRQRERDFFLRSTVSQGQSVLHRFPVSHERTSLDEQSHYHIAFCCSLLPVLCARLQWKSTAPLSPSVTLTGLNKVFPLPPSCAFSLACKILVT